ncbi:phosphotransferase [Microlunatus capsulatus]|uniref:Aminoglycoside phosphotransferase domain-containing protein n=1 Tax=Microlunatus capsulatus TaxID=99117 RepID=A0ABS4ZDM0_9ACTN|nr:phosphotransferase [Microlunatus capsulatus]MBP2419153.1 hypothetical protein [Microlunatus capsulatus]
MPSEPSSPGDQPAGPSHPRPDLGDLPGEVLADVARAVGTRVTPLLRLPGGANGGTVRVRLAGGTEAALKTAPRTHAGQLDETLRARRVVEHMRGHGYPTPAWLGTGATAAHVWHLVDLVDAPPATALTPSLVEQLMAVVELQAGQATEPYDHWSYAWRVATGRSASGTGPEVVETPEQSRLRRSVSRLSGHSPVVSALVEQLRLLCAHVPAPPPGPDMVHADLATPGNVLVRDGAVVAVVDLGNAGSGTRAVDLTTLLWSCYGDPELDGVRRRLWTTVLALVGGEAAAVLLASHVLLMLELPLRLGQPAAVPAVVERARRALDELHALR